MLPWIIGAAAIFVGKKIYDSVTENDDDSYSFEQKEQSDKKRQYENLLNEYKKYFKSKNIEVEFKSSSLLYNNFINFINCQSNTNNNFIKFIKSQELDELNEQIHSLTNDIKQLKEIQNKLKTKLEEIL
ncbi:hypothetical protein FPD38_04650 [Campylobacter volucris]|uniref:Uncharacterized protein n=1 Tax=Campylobacter volucris TaxID=1031542 RepID=A0A5C7E023_9BACT|nr:hypothetical protein [Campylobacter volucris]TXE88129.1 hypothetical protein FPD38_04650 [Campylobacter volucris]